MVVLTIDFDILMWPSIERYGHMLDNKNPRELLMKYQNDWHWLEMDLELYAQLTQLLLHFLGLHHESDDIFFIMEHHEIIPILESFNESIYLINMDHHHDVVYEDKDLDTNNYLNCGNWVLYAREHGILDHYVWINDPNSEYHFIENNKQEILDNVIQEQFEFEQYDLKQLPYYVDKIVFCYSKPWIFDYYHPLWYSWMNMASLINNFKYECIPMLDETEEKNPDPQDTKEKLIET